jgi:hypothetical protein
MACLTACHREQKQVRLVDDAIVFSGYLNFPPDDPIAKLVVNQIDENGERSSLDTISYDADRKFFRIEIRKDLMFTPGAVPGPEVMVAMSDPIPEYKLSEDGAVSSRILSTARLEFLQNEINKLSTQHIYSQLAIGFSQRDIFGINFIQPTENTVTLSRVGMTSVRVVDSFGVPIEGASVIGVVTGEIQSLDNPAISVAAWDLPFFRPIVSKSNVDGMTYITPLNATGDDKYYQVIAFGSGYCTYVLPITDFGNGSSDSSNIRLRTCDSPEANPNESIAEWIYESADEAPLVSENFPNREDPVNVLYSNKKFVNLRVDSTNRILRGFDVEVVEGHSEDRKTVTFRKEFKRFSSELEIELPAVFSSTKTPNGEFTIIITGRANSSLEESPEKMPKLLIYGRKNIDRPPLAFLKTVEIVSELGVSSVISGITGGKFTVRSEQCFDGQFLGLKYKNDSIVFAVCHDKSADFVTKDFSFSSDSNQLGGKIGLGVFLRNKYLTVSESAPSGEHVKQVYVDYTYPQPGLGELQLKMGITRIGEAPGNVESRYLFPLGDVVDGKTDTIVVTPATLDKLVFRFASPQSCISTATADDSDSTEQLGNGIFGMFIASNAALAAESRQIAGCAIDGKASDLPIGNSSMLFPQLSDGNAVYFLKVWDLAGHDSAPLEISIPPCPADVDSVPGTRICWRN